MCGEKNNLRQAFAVQQGSPPRVRGKVVHRPGRRLRLGITPAYAGKSFFCDHGSLAKQDHPRACGEKTASSTSPGECKGSPPRMRGKVDCGTFELDSVGITPAHAGKRMEKEYLKQAKTGSPPRMRGKGYQKIANELRLGITPAHAGKRFLMCSSVSSSKDHPRACGEKRLLLVRICGMLGSPPRMRGKVQRRKA